MTTSNQLKLFKEELLKLQQIATYPYVKNILNNEIQKLAQQIPAQNNFVNYKTQPSTTKILNYGWDQNNDYLEIFLTLNGIQSISQNNIDAQYGERSVEVVVNELGGKNYSFLINNLCEIIDPEYSKFKIKTDLLVIHLKKKSKGKHWPCVTENEKKQKELKDSKFKPSLDKDNSNPEKALMDLMKKMYDDGDDEMKRTIQKSWHESQEKQSKGMF
ncbi:unnamed protein product [Gordionus sp. m RMFG-2023]|uniref:calcyclin-binding protein-like n=1 Tax=Gordionus sp. m RMFG-2023 TaxID=3053472 RepID=UPI0030DEBF86